MKSLLWEGEVRLSWFEEYVKPVSTANMQHRRKYAA